MKDIDQFIDEVLFKESDQYKLIYETVLQEMIKIEEIPDEGVAAEYIFALALKKKLNNIPKIFIQTSSRLIGFTDSEINIAIDNFLKERTKKRLIKQIKDENKKLPPDQQKSLPSDKDIEEKTKERYEKIFAVANSYIDKRLDDLSLESQFDKNDIREIHLIGRGDKSYSTSADIELITVNQRGAKQKFRLSIKFDNEYIFQMGNFIPDLEQTNQVKIAVKNPNLNVSVAEPSIYQMEGGGYERLYKVFDLSSENITPIEDEKKFWENIKSDFIDKFNMKYINGGETTSFFTVIANLITRGDDKVYSLAELTNLSSSVLPSLLNKFVSNFKLEAFTALPGEFVSSKKSAPQQSIPKQEPTGIITTRKPNDPRSTGVTGSGEQVPLTRVDKPTDFRSFGAQSRDLFTIQARKLANQNEQIEEPNKKEADRIKIKILFEENEENNLFYIKDISSNTNLSDKQKHAIEKITEKNNLEAQKVYSDFLLDLRELKEYEIPDELKEFTNGFEVAREKFENLINQTLSSLINMPVLIFIRIDDKKIKFGTYKGLYHISDINKIFSFLERESTFQNLKQCFSLFLDNKEAILNIVTAPTESTNESLFESLILEALNEKELNKVIKKVSSSSPKGFVSALPSNKTNNSVAVRFEDDESIDSGIKKIKSSLKSSGYQLEDQRVLKFDQNRDTTDVIKNGEVVARLFFRADIKERQGLAYEHIIGSVLTGYITDQLKNRIDLPPDASDEEVNEKLNSEKFKHLYDSAKKAAPIIQKKVGKVVKAESVGSTNNKADFVLQTQDGKTVGLSAKYAAGEKDNEYKMNKVLGFGTEDESLVYNPKGIPWWVVGRKTFLKKLQDQTGDFKGKSYDPDYETLDAPAWMKSAKEKHADVYKETMEEVYGAVRNILTRNLRRMKIKDLVSFVMEADLGKEEERENYDMFIKVVDGPSGLSVNEVNIAHQDTTNFGNLDPEQVVVQDRSDIIIKLPGFQELKINSVKFKSDMLSSKAGDLKIKTR